ncbi:MAG: histidine kinase [Ferruginibacter sp.]
MRKFASIQLILTLCCASLHGQPASFFWENDTIELLPENSGTYQTKVYGTKDGMASSEITCLAQDSKGYLWVGTSAGVSRYDGITFENFLKAGNHFIGKIYAIKEDVLNNIIWIACDAGLCYFRNDQLSFVHFKEAGVTTYDVHFLQKDLWVATGKGPAFFTRKIIDKITKGDTISLDNLLLPQWKLLNHFNMSAYKITSSEKGDIYIGGEGVIFLYSNKNLHRIWLSVHDQNNNDEITGLVPGRADTVFFASTFSGLYYIKKDTVIKIADDKYIAGDFIKHHNQYYYFTWAGIYEFFSSTFFLKKISTVPESLNIWISCLLLDNENNLWVGMHDNLIYQKPKIFTNYISKRTNMIPELYSVYQLKDGRLLFGANRGRVYKKDGDTFRNFFGNGGVVPHSEIKGIYQDSRGWFWLGSGYEGIVVVEGNVVRHFTKADGLSSKSNYFFYEDSSGNIYTGGDGGFSKIIVNGSSKQFVFKNFNYKLPGENLETFKNCIGGPGNIIWAAGQKGLFYLKDDSIVNYQINRQANLNIADIKKDKSGNVWIATKGDGIWECFFNADNMLALKKIYNQKNGLLSDIYLNLAIDNNNDIWAASYSGVTSFKKHNNKTNITNYTAANGFLSSNYQSIKIFCDQSDTVWVATSSGLSSFYTGNTKINEKVILNFTKIALTDTSKKISFYIKNESGAVTELPHFLNGIEFHFKAICLSDPQQIKYSYRLLGIEDSAWLEWDNKENAVYQNLSSGNYSFQVKASVGNKIATAPIAFSFIIKKPFWLAWWFMLAVAVVAIFIFYFFKKKWEKNIHKKNEEKINNEKLISENLQYRLEIEQVTNYFTSSMSDKETVDDLLWDVVRRCISKFNFEDCVIYLKDEKTNMLIQKAAIGPKSNVENLISGETNKIITPLEIPMGTGIVGSVADSGVAEIVGDVTKDSRYIIDDEQRYSEIAVPIIYNGSVLGVIDSENSIKNFYTQMHLQILTTIASHCAERIIKLKAEKDLERNELQLLQVQKRLAEEKLTALRSQMNPHFIFNCLNSVQQFILKGEVDNANKYLSQFSKLIRLVLEYSEYNFISLEDEINMLHLYLALEKTRFGNSFEYSIEVDEGLDTDEIKIPNLMIQPFVENAIWHGLMHKEGDRKIDISFHLENDQSIIAKIVDNGIGRQKAEGIKQKKSLDVKHESRGIKLIKDKINILKEQFESEIFIELIDVTNKDGSVSGTSVVIQLPLQY